MSGKSVLHDGPLDVSRAPRSREVFKLPYIDATPNGDSSPAQASEEVQAKSSSRSRRHLNTTSKRSTKRRRKSTMRTRADAAKAFSDDLPVIDLESDLE